MSEELLAEAVCLLGCTPETAFSAWIDPAILPSWLAPPPYDLRRAEVDGRLGGHYRHDTTGPDGNHVVKGQYHDFEPNHRLAKSWEYSGPNPVPRPESTRVSVEFTPMHNGGTRVRLVHSRLRDPREQEHYRAGWADCFERLSRLYPLDIMAPRSGGGG